MATMEQDNTLESALASIKKMTYMMLGINIDELVNKIEESTNYEQTLIDNIKQWEIIRDNITILTDDVLSNPKLFTIIKFILENDKNKEFQQLHKSLITLLYTSFFDLSPEVVRDTLEFVKKNITSLPSEELINDNEKEDILTQYLTKLLPIKQFIGEDLKDDKFLNIIKQHKLKDKELFIKIFDTIDYKQLLEIFDDDLSKFLKFLDEVDYIDIRPKYLAVLNFFDKLMEEEEYLYLLDLIIDNNDSPLWKKYLDDEYYNKILLGCLNTPVTSLTSKQITFLLTTDFKEEHNKSLKIMQDLAQGNFMIQCSYLVRKGTKLNKIPDFNLNEIKETLYKINPGFGKNPKTIDKEDSLETKKEKTQDSYLKGYDIDINMAVELLRAVFRGQIKGSPILGQAIIRSIGTYLQEQIGIESNGIYFYDSKYSNGQFEENNNTIGITHKLVRRLVDNNQPISVRLKVFDTLPHEIKHNLVNQNQRQGKWDILSYEKKKEMLIRKYAPNFYETNYLQFKEEIDARIAGANGMQKLVELFLPEYLDEVQDELIKKLEKEKTTLNDQDHNRSMEFLSGLKVKFQLGFDTLVKYNSNIIEENPIFKLEYNSNGQPKTYEEIWLGRTEENKDLIDGILKLRYPEPDNQVLTK